MLQNIPLVWAKYIAVIFFVAMIIWALLLPKEYILKGAPDRKPWRDLRVWAVIILIVQIILYIKF
jgi:hypothetical protein